MTDARVWYRNAGASLRTDVGQVVESGEVVVPTPRCLAQRKLRRVTAPPEIPPRAEGWTLPLPPETDAALHPDGPLAARAREIAGGKEAVIDGTDG